jgi:transglutaminase-like putative cysteine protease
MSTHDEPTPGDRTEPLGVVGCEMALRVTEPAEVVAQIVASRSAGHVDHAQFEVLVDGEPLSSLDEIQVADGSTMHVIGSNPGRLTLRYRATITRWGGSRRAERRAVAGPGGAEAGPPPEYERQVYLRPSRYCPSDHLVGFAVAEFGAGPDAGARTAAIAAWIRQRIGYVPGSSSVHDSAEDTLLKGTGTCRDFAHLGIALCRATGVPARFAAVYAPGLSPMDFHAVFEAYQGGRWYVYDPTGLAPRSSLVRIATGRDAADAAFAAVTSGVVDLERIEVTAVAEPFRPEGDPLELVELD